MLNWSYGKTAVQHAMQAVAASGVGIAADIIDEEHDVGQHPHTAEARRRAGNVHIHQLS